MARAGLHPVAKGVYATGDFTINTALSALSLVYAGYFLTQVAGLPGTLAGLVPLIGRFVDAFTDPAMGRLSDLTHLRAGRRRPYFLIGALPFGISFALLWTEPGIASVAGRFAYYTLVYCALSLSMTILAVPYLALLPEMATGYDDRTSLIKFDVHMLQTHAGGIRLSPQRHEHLIGSEFSFASHHTGVNNPGLTIAFEPLDLSASDYAYAFILKDFFDLTANSRLVIGH